jgi:hypothetical protein
MILVLLMMREYSGETTVLKTKGSDHWPVLVEFDGDQTD